MKYDLIIVGMGIAGISAAIYAKNSGLNVLMIERDTPGGLVNKINTIHNYPGHSEVTGPDLGMELFQSVNRLKIPYKMTEVLKIEVENNQKVVKTTNEDFTCKNVIIATGRENRRLGLEYETELLGRGISTCALCDGNLYEGKDVCVVGGGNSALEEALYLSNIVSKVYLIHRRNSFRAENTWIEKVKEKENIEIIYDSEVVKILHDEDKFSGVVLHDGTELSVSAMFLYIGFEPNNHYVESLDILSEDGYIEVDKNYETKVKGIYAVGDCVKKEVYQLVTAANDGVMAALHIIKEKED